MKGLADIALWHFRLFMFSDDESIDPDFAVREMESFPAMMQALTPGERAALSAAAQRELDLMAQPPDQYGYKPVVNKNEKAFLEAMVSGEAFQ